MTTEAQDVPRMVDPGEAGYALEPKVSAAEVLLYGDLAGIVRRLGEAAVAIQDAYSLSCKHNITHEEQVMTGTRLSREVLDNAVRRTWALYEDVQGAYREIAGQAGTVTQERAFPAKMGAVPA